MGIAEVVKELKFHRILRYTLSGSFLHISYFLFSSQSIDKLREFLQTHLLTTLLLSLLIGIAIYAIHRAILYTIFGRLSLGLAKRWPELPIEVFSWKWWLYLHRPTQFDLKLDRARWNRRGNIQDDLDEWGGHIHFMYCSAWAILFGDLLAWLMAEKPVKTEINWMIVGAFFIFLVCAFVADCRAWHYEIDFEKNPGGSP